MTRTPPCSSTRVETNGCGNPLRSSHRREDDIRRQEFHAVCGFSLERISSTKLVFVFICARGFCRVRAESYEHRPLKVVRGRWECSIFLYLVDCQCDALSIQRFIHRVHGVGLGLFGNVDVGLHGLV